MNWPCKKHLGAYKKQFTTPVDSGDEEPMLKSQVTLINQDWELNPQILEGPMFLEITNF